MNAASGSPGPIEQTIKQKLINEFKPTHLDIKNDSWKHASHHGLKGATNTTESHFRIDIVSEKFQGKNQPTRHRLIYKLLDDEIKLKGVHALQMKTKTVEEHNKKKKPNDD